MRATNLDGNQIGTQIGTPIRLANARAHGPSSPNSSLAGEPDPPPTAASTMKTTRTTKTTKTTPRLVTVAAADWVRRPNPDCASGWRSKADWIRADAFLSICVCFPMSTRYPRRRTDTLGAPHPDSLSYANESKALPSDVRHPEILVSEPEALIVRER
jgi:hypothetical protein